MDALLNNLKKDIQENLPENVTVLVKGSRFMKMERAVEALSLPLGETA